MVVLLSQRKSIGYSVLRQQPPTDTAPYVILRLKT